jgi:hypothetical protein
VETVTAVVHNPVLALTSPALLLVACALVALAMWRNTLPLRIVATAWILCLVLYREEIASGAFLRAATRAHDARQLYDETFRAGAGAMYDYVSATRAYGEGCCALLALLVIWRGRRSAEQTVADAPPA